MKKPYLLLPILFLIYWGCEEPDDKDTTPPTVTITSPQNNSSVSEVVSITCMSSDNEGVDKVELWVNGVSTGLIDDSEPYSFDWNTTTLEDGNYTIIVRSYDTSENTTDSEQIVVTVDNTLSIPTPSVLYPIIYNDGFQISWSQNNDDDFQSYKLYESLSEDMGVKTLVYETEVRTDTTYFKTILNYMYYKIVVEDIWGFQSSSNIEFGEDMVELWGFNYSVLNTTVLDKHNNQLTGSIPPEIGNLTNLTKLYLYDNQLTGSIPPEIGNLTNLTELFLQNNQLTDSIPPEIGNLTNLTDLDLSVNQLTGEIPESICDFNINWSSSGNFNITNNQLCPPYPSCIEDYVGNQDTSDCP